MGDRGAVELVHENAAVFWRSTRVGDREVRGGLPFPRWRSWHLRCVDDLKALAAASRSCAGVVADELDNIFVGALREVARGTLAASGPISAGASSPDAFFAGKLDRVAIWNALRAYFKMEVVCRRR